MSYKHAVLSQGARFPAAPLKFGTFHLSMKFNQFVTEGPRLVPSFPEPRLAPTILTVMAKPKKETFEVACPDCGAMLLIDASTGVVVSHTPAPRKRTFEDLETAAKAMREQDERKESIFRQSIDAEKNKEDLFEKKFAEALRKAKDAPEGKPLREFDLD
jgi:hypothetical protein